MSFPGTARRCYCTAAKTTGPVRIEERSDAALGAASGHRYQPAASPLRSVHVDA